MGVLRSRSISASAKPSPVKALPSAGRPGRRSSAAVAFADMSSGATQRTSFAKPSYNAVEYDTNTMKLVLCLVAVGFVFGFAMVYNNYRWRAHQAVTWVYPLYSITLNSTSYICALFTHPTREKSIVTIILWWFPMWFTQCVLFENVLYPMTKNRLWISFSEVLLFTYIGVLRALGWRFKVNWKSYLVVCPMVLALLYAFRRNLFDSVLQYMALICSLVETVALRSSTWLFGGYEDNGIGQVYFYTIVATLVESVRFSSLCKLFLRCLRSGTWGTLLFAVCSNILFQAMNQTSMAFIVKEKLKSFVCKKSEPNDFRRDMERLYYSSVWAVTFILFPMVLGCVWAGCRFNQDLPFPSEDKCLLLRNAYFLLAIFVAQEVIAELACICVNLAVKTHPDFLERLSYVKVVQGMYRRHGAWRCFAGTVGTALWAHVTLMNALK